MIDSRLSTKEINEIATLIFRLQTFTKRGQKRTDAVYGELSLLCRRKSTVIWQLVHVHSGP